MIGICAILLQAEPCKMIQLAKVYSMLQAKPCDIMIQLIKSPFWMEKTWTTVCKSLEKCDKTSSFSQPIYSRGGVDPLWSSTPKD